MEIFTGCKILKCVMWPRRRPKFEVSNYSHYEDMRNGAKCTNWGSLGRFGVTQGHPQCHHPTFYSTLLETMHLCCTVSRYSQLFVEIRLFWHTPPAFGVPVGGDPGRISQRSFVSKTRLPELSCGFVCVVLCLTVIVELRLVTDTDRHGHRLPWLVPRMHSIAR